MTRILPIGYDPEAVDYSDPALPPGMSVEKVRADIAVAMKKFADHGWEADVGRASTLRPPTFPITGISGSRNIVSEHQ